MSRKILNEFGIRTLAMFVRTQWWSHYLWRKHRKEVKKLVLNEEGANGVALLATNVGSNLPAVVGDSLIGLALRKQGFAVKVALCDGALPACMACTSEQFRDMDYFAEQGPSKLTCKVCFSGANKLFQSMGFDVIRLSDFVGSNVDTKTSSPQLDDHARAGTVRFLKAEIDKRNRVHSKILDRYSEAAKLVETAYERIYSRYQISQVVAHHGIYVPQGVVVQVAQQRKISVATWTVGYRNSSILYGVGDTYHRTMISDTDWRQVNLDPNREFSIMQYLLSREKGSQDVISFIPRPNIFKTGLEERKIREKLKSKPQRLVVSLYTNVVWDASIHFENDMFNGMLEWLKETLLLLSNLDCWVIVRIHPAERRGFLASEQDVFDEITNQFSQIPDNFIIIDSSSSASSYEIARMSSFAVTYASKMAIELSARAIPVIVAGQGWTRNKGFTTDPISVSDYMTLIKQWVLNGPDEMSHEQINNAKKFAYHVFFVRMRELDSLKPRSGFPPFSISKKAFGIDGQFSDSKLLELTKEWLPNQ